MTQFEDRVESLVSEIKEEQDGETNESIALAHARVVAAYEQAVDDATPGQVAGAQVAALLNVCECAGIPEHQLVASIKERYEGGVEA